MSEQMSIGTHPDLVSLRARYESASETIGGMVIGGTTFLAGLFLAASPWVVGFSDQDPMLFNDLIVGVAVAILGLGLTSAFDRVHRLAWTVPVLGLWTIVSPWVVQTGDFARSDNEWTNVVTGAVLLLTGLALTAMTFSREARTELEHRTRMPRSATR